MTDIVRQLLLLETKLEGQRQENNQSQRIVGGMAKAHGDGSSIQERLASLLQVLPGDEYLRIVS